MYVLEHMSHLASIFALGDLVPDEELVETESAVVGGDGKIAVQVESISFDRKILTPSLCALAIVVLILLTMQSAL